MISIHTIELTMEVDKDTFDKWRDKVRYKIKYNKDTGKDYSFVEDGITIWYYKTEYKRKIKLLVNPSRVLGFDDLVTLWKPKKKNIAKLLSKLDENINSYFDFEYKLRDFKLTRIDFTKNIQLGSRDKVSAYIKVLYNIRKVKGFSPKYNKHDKWYDDDIGFDLKGNSNGIEFTAYDKEACIKQQASETEMEFRKKEREARLARAKGILRIEVKLTTQKAIRAYTNEEDTIRRIIELSANSGEIFLDTFNRVVPPGDFYKKDEAVRLIDERVADKKLKKKMLRLLELIPKKKSLYLAIKEMNDRNIDRALTEFCKHNISPVTISKRHNIKHLKSLYAFI